MVRQVMATYSRLAYAASTPGAPGGIRTCAPASGGRVSMRSFYCAEQALCGLLVFMIAELAAYLP
jgi:hypothetical protein